MFHVKHYYIKKGIDTMPYIWDTTPAEDLGKVNAAITHVLTHTMPALESLIDSGAKNKLSIDNPASVPSGLTCTKNDNGTYTISGTLTAANSITFNIDAISGNLVLSGCPAGGGSDSYLLRLTKSGSQVANTADTGKGSGVFTMEGSGYALNIRFAAGTYSDVVFSPMICSEIAWAISRKYVPYQPSYAELVSRVEALENPETKKQLHVKTAAAADEGKEG